MREHHEVADLLEDDLPHHVGEAGRVERVRDPAQVEVDLRRSEEVDLR